VVTDLTIDELARASGSTTRSIRSLQTLGLIDPPTLRGRTGLYGLDHLDRVRAILRLQAAGFALHSLVVLFEAYERGDTLPNLLGLPAHATGDPTAGESDITELYGFADLLGARRGRRPRGTPLLSVVPTTVWDETEAS
jgi:DNA-binding transcriptional MerR regulator